MTQHLTADEAAALVQPVDAIGMPLGPGQPPGFLEALGRRTDWEDLRINGALLSVFTDLFTHPNVHYLSGFYGPLERLLRDSGANIGFAPADFRRFIPLLAALAPRVMVTAGALPDADGNVSLSLHAGANVAEMRQAAADPDRLLIVEVSEHFPRTYGAGDHTHCLRARRDRHPRRERQGAGGDRRSAAHRRRPSHRRARARASCPTARPSRRGSARCRRSWHRSSPKATGATTASTPRCSPRA